MSVINRIEIVNWLNLDKNRDWRPDYRQVILDLRGQSTAIQAHNGMGKTRMTRAILALLGRDREFTTDARVKMAPRTANSASHFRVELLHPTDSRQDDLLTRTGGQGAGETYVLGMFGYSGDGQKITFYKFDGRLEDCPTAHRDGHRITLLPDDEFRKALRVMPSVLLDASEEEWLLEVGKHFDRGQVRQMIDYQKKGGGDGTANFFQIRKSHGERYDEAFFFSVLAPELLVGTMGSEALEGERRFEDTILISSRRISQALSESNRKRKEMEDTKRALDMVEMVATAARETADARGNYQAQCQKLAGDGAFLKKIVVEHPMPGIPASALPEHPQTAAIACHLRLQNDQWLLPDWAISVMTGEETSRVNERASRRGFQPTALGRQVIEIPCDHGTDADSGPAQRHQGGGPGNNAYQRTQAVALVDTAPRFADGWSREAALRAVNHALDWAAEKADTNFARRELITLETAIAAAESELRDAEKQLTDLDGELEKLNNKRVSMDAARHAYAEMAGSGLFSGEELRAPVATGQVIQTSLNATEARLHEHLQKTGRHETTFGKWQRFVNEQGGEANPAIMADGLESNNRTSTTVLQAARQRKQGIDVKLKGLDAQLKAGVRRQNDLAGQIDRLTEPRQFAARLEELFPGERLDGLLDGVKRELTEAKSRQAQLKQVIVSNEKPLQQLASFREAYPSANPGAVLAERTLRRDELTKTCQTLVDERADAERRRKELNKAQVAANSVSHKVLDAAGPKARPLHVVVDELGLDDSRRRLALTHFSGLLFAPVFETIDEAEAAARDLHAKDLAAPVFSWAELAEFCMEGDVRESTGGAYSFMLGARTRPVDCLLDPELVEREKKALDERIAAIADELAAAENERATLLPDHPVSRMIEAARNAEENKLEEVTKAANTELSAIATGLPRLEQRASQDSIDVIRGAENFTALGGESQYQRLVSDKHGVDQTIGHLEAEIGQLQSEISGAETDVSKAEEAFNRAARAMDQVPLLRELAKFVRDGGPDFMGKAPTIRRSIEAEIETLRQRGRFRFGLAEQHVKTQAGEGDRIDQLIQEKGEEKRHLVDARKALNEKVAADRKERDRYRPAKDQLDEAARRIIAQYRLAQSALSDLQIDVAPDPAAHESNELKTAYSAAARVAMAMEEREAWTDIVERIDELRGDVEELDVKGRTKHIDTAKGVLEAARKKLNAEIKSVVDDKSLKLASNERNFLVQAKDDPARANEVWRHLETQWTKDSRTSEEAHAALLERRAELATALRNMTTRLTGNFETMRRAMHWKSDKDTGELLEAGVQIKATIHSESQTEQLLNDIVEMIEREENHRQEQIQHGESDALVSQEQYDGQLKDRIRLRFYRGMFSDAEIKMRHPELRAGEAHRMENTISTGQQNAVMLMLLLKLADFAIERDVRLEIRDPRARRKAKSLAQKVFIIDGLFSNLSNRELIKESLRAMSKVRGNFQLVGLIHNPHYQNDPEIFPNHIVLARMKQGKTGGYIYLADGKPVTPAALGRNDGEIETLSMISERIKPDQTIATNGAPVE